MGLRERNAASTRERLIQTALDLFVAQGFEHTTMEQVAERAEVSPSTLYRYFPSKELLVTEPLALRGQMAAELTSRPADEPLDVALGHALTALLATPRPGTAELRRLSALVEATPALRDRMLKELDRERELLEQAIAVRQGRREDDLFCRMTARLATSLVELVGARVTAPEDNATAVRETLGFLRVALDQLRREPPVLPRLEPIGG